MKLRYEIHGIANEHCTAIEPGALASASNLEDARRLAAVLSNRAWGVAIVDTQTNIIDYGLNDTSWN